MPRVTPGKVVGLIGYPLRHSVSPAFQQAAFDYLALPVRYVAWETPPEAVADVLARARRPDCLGLNVTIPHKETVLKFLDAVDERARQIGAVNTIVNRGGRLTGYNTDADGFLRALRERGQYEPSGKRVVLLGAGGAARAVALGLAWAGVARLAIFNRTVERATSLAAAVRSLAPDVQVEGLPWQKVLLRDRLGGADLLVNTTPIGMKHGPAGSPVPGTLIPAGAMVYDLVYNPAETQLLRDASRAGARTLGGLPMLVYQGAAAFEIWTGQRPPIGLMMKRAEEALQAAAL
jgi:shikimate dehydrogenase